MEVTPCGTVNVVLELNVWVTGLAKEDAVTTISSVEAAQPVLEMVQRKV